MKTLKVGISTYAEMKARTLAVARGEHRVADEPRVWFTSTESFAKVLSAGNRELLRIISEAAPGSIEELAQLTGVRSRMSPERLRRWQAMDLFASNLASAADLRQKSSTIGWN